MTTKARYAPQFIQKTKTKTKITPETIVGWEIEKQVNLSTLSASNLFSVCSFNRYYVLILGAKHCVRCWLKLNFML